MPSRRRRLIFGTGNDGQQVSSTALQKIGGAWFVVTDNEAAPDGYFVQQNEALLIDETASGGLSFSLDGSLTVNT